MTAKNRISGLISYSALYLIYPENETNVDGGT